MQKYNKLGSKSKYALHSNGSKSKYAIHQCTNTLRRSRRGRLHKSPYHQSTPSGRVLLLPESGTVRRIRQLLTKEQERQIQQVPPVALMTTRKVHQFCQLQELDPGLTRSAATRSFYTQGPQTLLRQWEAQIS